METRVIEDVRVWLVDIGDIGGIGELDEDTAETSSGLASCLALLGSAEMQRYRRFVRAQRRRQFLAGRLLLRYAASLLLDVAPQALSVTERTGQAPLLSLDDGRRPPFFSLSHSGRWVACAISAGHPVGLDIEVMRGDRDLPALAGQAFGTAGAQELAALPAAEYLAAFYQRWSRQEACFKLGDAGADGAAPVCIDLPHPALSFVVCSAGMMPRPPAVTTLWIGQLIILLGARVR
jgi:4'-phosphopantetheinyl transferase